MTVFDKMMKHLEERDYSDIPEGEQHLLHLFKMRDRLAYYACQLGPFNGQPPGDLPVIIGGQGYRETDLMTLQMEGRSVVEYYDLLTDIEAALTEAAGRRGMVLLDGDIGGGGTGGEKKGGNAPSLSRRRKACR